MLHHLSLIQLSLHSPFLPVNKSSSKSALPCMPAVPLSALSPPSASLSALSLGILVSLQCPTLSAFLSSFLFRSSSSAPLSPMGTLTPLFLAPLLVVAHPSLSTLHFTHTPCLHTQHCALHATIPLRSTLSARHTAIHTSAIACHFETPQCTELPPRPIQVTHTATYMSLCPHTVYRSLSHAINRHPSNRVFMRRRSMAGRSFAPPVSQKHQRVEAILSPHLLQQSSRQRIQRPAMC